MKALLFASFSLVLALPVEAQVSVGYPANRSPFRDLEFHQELTAFGGYFKAAKDVAGVAPQSAPLAGLRYEVTVGGPLQLVARFARVNSERNVIDPTKAEASRSLGTQSWPIYLADAGLSVNLTGQRSWHGVVPVVSTGFGIVTDAGKKVDEDPYRLGTTFAISFGGGLRFVPGGRFHMRADIGTYMYQIKYPTAYYTAPTDGTAVLESSQAKSSWKRNPALTLGVSYFLFH
jgi:hypothetical protein